MTFALTPDEEKLAARPRLASMAGPNRDTSGLFRAADGSDPTALGFGSRTAAEDAVVAAVRMAYKVADAQVQRGARLAERLNRAADAVPDGARAHVASAFDHLTLRAVLDKVGWLEGLASEANAPLQRLIAAQRELIGAMLGVTSSAGGASAPAPEKGGGAGATAPPPTRIFLTGDERRAVKLTRVDVPRGALPEVLIAFYPVETPGDGRLEGAFARAVDGAATLTVSTSLMAAAGRWRAAVCKNDGEQIGVIEIEI